MPWRAYEYAELVNRDKGSLDIFGLRDESLQESDNILDPNTLAQEIVEDLEAALEQFREIVPDLARRRCAHREKINRRAIILASRSVSHRYRVQLLACLGCTEASFNLRVSYRSVLTVTCGLANRLCRRFVMYAIFPKILCFCFWGNLPEANLSILLVTP